MIPPPMVERIGGMWHGVCNMPGTGSPTTLDVPNSDTYSSEYRSHVRVMLDGKPDDVPINTQLHIANVLQYQKLHSVAGHDDFQLRRGHAN